MPALSNPRREKACQERANGGNITNSYQAAGYNGSPQCAAQFFKKPEIVARVNEIVQDRYEDERKSREIATEEAGIDKSWFLKRVKYLADVSLQRMEITKGRDKDGQPLVVGYRVVDGPTAVKCLTLVAQVSGWMVQRHEVGAPGDFARMTDEELNESLVAQARGLGLPEDAVGRLLELKAEPVESAE